MGIRNKIAGSTETTTIPNTIQNTKVVLMDLVITATRLDTSKKVDIRNRGMNKEIIMELVINATSLDISNNIAARNKGMNKQISQRTKNHQKLL